MDGYLGKWLFRGKYFLVISVTLFVSTIIDQIFIVDVAINLIRVCLNSCWVLRLPLTSTKSLGDRRLHHGINGSLIDLLGLIW
jgi:hypothetical protein